MIHEKRIENRERERKKNEKEVISINNLMRFLIPQVWCPQTLTREQSVLWVKKCFPIIKILSSKLGARSKEDWFFED